MFDGYGGRAEEDRSIDPGEPIGFDEMDRGPLRLGHDVRFQFVAVGGGGIRIGRELARHRPRYIETIAIHTDPSVQGLEEFDRRVTLQAEVGAEPSGPSGAGTLARAAEPALERIFDGAAFVTIVGSLGGASGTGLFPSVVEAACRSAVVVSVFAVKPFEAEGDRRGLAERTLARLHFLESFVDKQQRGHGHLQVLDNELLARRQPKMPIKGLATHWADLIREHVERTYLRPAEAALAASRIAQLGEAEPLNRFPTVSPGTIPEEPEPRSPAVLPRLLPAARSAAPFRDVEVTFEVELPARPPGSL